MLVSYHTGIYSIISWSKQLGRSNFLPTPASGVFEENVLLRSSSDGLMSSLVAHAPVRRPVGGIVPKPVRVFNWRHRSLGGRTSFFGLTIRITKNNVFMVVYSIGGKIVFWLTRGRSGHNFALYTVINVSLVRLMLGAVLKILEESPIGSVIHCLTIRGRVPTKRIVRDLRQARLFVRTIRVSQPLPHNGCRLPRRRRGARN